MTASDYISIGGKRLILADLINRRFFDTDYLHVLRGEMLTARPFAHLVLEYIFHDNLLELASKEFDVTEESDWRVHRSYHELTRRSIPGVRMGTALHLYFGIVNSAWFLHFALVPVRGG